MSDHESQTGEFGFSFTIDPENVTFTELVRIYKRINDVLQPHLKGNLYVFESNIQIGESLVLPLTSHVTRNAVHEAIATLLSARQAEVQADLEERFPSSTWGDIYPVQSAMQTLLEALIAEDESEQ